MLEVRCPVCHTSFEVAKNGSIAHSCDNGEGIGYLVPKTIRNENIKGGSEMNAKYNDRINKLEAAGFDVSILNSLLGEKNVEAILENCMKNDSVAEEIYASGYVKNTKLHRRYVMAQTFKLLGDDNDWSGRLHNYSYDYTFKMMLKELKVLAILEREDEEAFNERSMFFTREVVYYTILDYKKKLLKKICKLPVKLYRNKIPYVTLQSRWYIPVDEISKIVETPLNEYAEDCLNAENYSALYESFGAFLRNKLYIKLPNDTAKCSYWIEAYKGAGAYYTLKNLFMFHNCMGVKYNEENYTSTMLNTDESLKDLSKKLKEYKGQGWRMLAYLKEVIYRNNFDFHKRMEEIYSNK